MNGNANVVMSSSRRAGFSSRSAGAFDRVLVVAAACALLATGSSWLAQLNWLFELLTHFRLQLAGGAVLVLAFALLRRKAAPTVLAGLVAAVNGVYLAPYLLLPPTPAAEATQQHVRVMAANVAYGNDDYAALREAVRHENPDIVGLVEVTEAWARELAPLRADYPFAIVRGEDGVYGLALLSRVPVRELAASPYVEGGIQTAIIAEVALQEKRVTLILSHLRAPTGKAKATLRNEQLRRIAAMIEADGNKEQILVGDLNTTPWSPYYRELEESAGVANAARGRGYVSTWPSWLPTALLRIPIDHCLLSDGLRIQQFRTGPDVGSDHLPIVADIALAEPVPAESI